MGDYMREIEDFQKGLYQKYTVINNSTGKPVEEDCFILKPAFDSAAIKAIETYAENTSNRLLANELLEWIEKYK